MDAAPEHVAALTEVSGVEVAYICDVDDRAIAKGMAKAGKQAITAQAQDAQGFPERRWPIRRLTRLPSPRLTTGTLLWRFLAWRRASMCTSRSRLCHNPYEGELAAQAVTKYKRVLQMGAQRRSFPNLQQAIRELHDGAIGKTYFARGWYTNSRASIGYGKPAAVPKELDYELWQGPAPRRAYVDNLIHYNWHWNWHWGTGEALNNGTHEIDVARWALGVSWPTRVDVRTSGLLPMAGRLANARHAKPHLLGFSPEGKSMAWEGREVVADSIHLKDWTAA